MNKQLSRLKRNPVGLSDYTNCTVNRIANTKRYAHMLCVCVPARISSFLTVFKRVLML